MFNINRVSYIQSYKLIIIMNKCKFNNTEINNYNFDRYLYHYLNECSQSQQNFNVMNKSIGQSRLDKNESRNLYFYFRCF